MVFSILLEKTVISNYGKLLHMQRDRALNSLQFLLIPKFSDVLRADL
jgi:hypothetical protein